MRLNKAITQWTPPAINKGNCQKQYSVLDWLASRQTVSESVGVLITLEESRRSLVTLVSQCGPWRMRLSPPSGTLRYLQPSGSFFSQLILTQLLFQVTKMPVESWFSLHDWERTNPLNSCWLIVATDSQIHHKKHFCLSQFGSNNLIHVQSSSGCVQVDLHLQCENTDCDIQLELNRHLDVTDDSKRFNLILALPVLHCVASHPVLF